MPKLSFYKDNLLMFAVVIIFAVFCFVQTQGIRKVDESVKKADLIAQCFTPGTKCYKISQQAGIKSAHDRTANSRCLLLWGSNAVKYDITASELFIGFDTCVSEQLKALEEE